MEKETKELIKESKQIIEEAHIIFDYWDLPNDMRNGGKNGN